GVRACSPYPRCSLLGEFLRDGERWFAGPGDPVAAPRVRVGERSAGLADLGAQHHGLPLALRRLAHAVAGGQPPVPVEAAVDGLESPRSTTSAGLSRSSAPRVAGPR